MPRLRPLAPFVLPIVLVAASLGCERLAGIDGDFERQSAGPGGSSPGVGGEGGGPGAQGSAGSVNGAGQAGASGGPPAMGSGGGGGGPPGPAATVTAFATGQDNVGQLTTDGNTLFWVAAGTEANGFNDGKVLSCSVNGCNDTPTIIAENQQKPEYIARADENVVQLPESNVWSSQIYWTNTLEGTVMRRKKDKSEPAAPVVTGLANPAGVGISSSAVSPGGAPGGDPFVYWAEGGANRVRACKLDPAGCAPGSTFNLTDAAAPGDTVAPGPAQLITGRSYVYWITHGTDAQGRRDGHLYRYRKNAEPVSSRPNEKRLFAMATNLRGAISFNLQSNNLFVTAGGAPGDPAPAGTLWVAYPLGNDGSAEQVKSFVASPSFADLIVTYQAVYWKDGAGTLYGCKSAPVPCERPVEIKRDLGTGPMTGESGNTTTTTDVLYSVTGRNIVKIQVPVAMVEGP